MSICLCFSAREMVDAPLKKMVGSRSTDSMYPLQLSNGETPHHRKNALNILLCVCVVVTYTRAPLIYFVRTNEKWIRDKSFGTILAVCACARAPANTKKKKGVCRMRTDTVSSCAACVSEKPAPSITQQNFENAEQRRRFRGVVRAEIETSRRSER